MHKKIVVALAAAASLAGIIATAPTASAEASPPDCPKGNVCVWDSDVTGGPTVIRTEHNWYGSHTFGHWGGSIFNNGVRYPGADHIQATWTFDGKTWDRCLHYNPGPGEYAIRGFAPGVTITSLVWRGEC
ncbi:peptidase inhibitor family I36 protein [Streptomyces fildesensis]|uniref:Peptidase inhibitor family I36 protein n=1 Tax=Streptomyces fildesensis TaxID=375757 RepID=A0ABW8C711_9ACTN